MRFWKKKSEVAGRKGVKLAALEGASREELAREALTELVTQGDADRLGVWLEPSVAEEGAAQETSFRGWVWDAESDAVPPEWKMLSPHTALPLDRLQIGKELEEKLSEQSGHALVGPLVGLHHALWVPVQHAGKLRGILMAGAATPQRILSKEGMESVAAELALVLALESERRVARQRQTDTALCAQVLANLSAKKEPASVLLELAESCTAHVGRPDSPGAVFALIGRYAGRTETIQGPRDEAEFEWKAGDEAWLQTAQTQPITELWRKALETGRTLGSELHPSWSKGEVARVIAVPLLQGAEPVGVMLAGFRPGTASLAALERIELRASLAAAALTAEREQREKLRQREKEQAILDVSGSPVVLLGLQEEIAESSLASRKLLASASSAQGVVGIPGEPPAIVGRQFAEFVRPKDRKKLEAWQRQLRTKNGGPNAESPELELSSGARVKLCAIEAGDKLHAVALRPSKPSSSAEDSQTRAELLNLVEWLEQGVILFDAQENVRLLNLRFAQLTGLAPEELDRHMTLDGLVERLSRQSADPGTFAMRWHELARDAEGGQREEVHLVRPAARVLERASRPVLDAKGNKLGRIELYRDLTAQRLFQAKLLQTERLAALGQMVSGVAHELSNPLTSILGYAQRMLLREAGADHSEAIRRIFAEAERAGAILRRMLLAARETAPERRVVSLNQLILRTIELQRFSLASERIRVDLALDPKLAPVMGDAGQLQQVLMNLLGNARQAIETLGHGGTIRVRTERGAGNRVRLEVSDSGPGIPEGIMARIFDPFFTTKPAGVGTGLGLAIVLSLVREHGGQVHASSPQGHGAIFIVDLPAAGEKAAAEKTGKKVHRLPVAASQEIHAANSGRKSLEARRVLVVEDEPTVAQLIADVLRDEGFQVEVLLGGRDALDRAVREPFDLVVCDMKMPNLDGASFYAAASQSKKTLQDKFLFVTGDVLGAKTHDFLEKNRLPHVAKPFRVEELLEKVYQVLQTAESRETRPAAAGKKNSATIG